MGLQLTTSRKENYDNGWMPIMSSNSHVCGTSILNYKTPSFEQLSVSDLIRVRVFSKQTPFVFNVLKDPNMTRVERMERVPLILKINEEYEGILLEKNTFFDEIKGEKTDIIKVMIGINNEQYFIYINSASCWYGGLIIYKLNSEF